MKSMPMKQVIMTLLIAFAVISFWRGIWGLMDIYFIPSNSKISFMLSTILGVIIVYLVKGRLKILE
ncbi:hypothetical protein J4226_00120 [Candidatus Pacearchaeota archaeon]|nr:hypothetical protein [Candidatus Pacearchaeota archaeon]